MSAKRLVIVISAKGGTGKTFFARYAADRYERHKVDVTLVDADPDVAQLQQYYDDAVPIEPTDVAGLLHIVDQAETPVILMDMPGRGLSDLRAANKEASMFDWLSQNRVDVTVINVVTPYRASTSSVGLMLDTIGDSDVTTIALLNRTFGPREDDWILWYGDTRLDIAESESRGRLLERGGIELQIPALRTSIPVLLDLTSETFSYALASNASSLKAAHMKQYLRTWLREMDLALRPIEGALGL
ncbi:MAG TPA: hypothetical protein VGZ02_17615 [Candidatus Baltobacteraceae bacterium]|nr:hypothetical protein [Candidatus Baltobacteraceae bacterium]